MYMYVQASMCAGCSLVLSLHGTGKCRGVCELVLANPMATPLAAMRKDGHVCHAVGSLVMVNGSSMLRVSCTGLGGRSFLPLLSVLRGALALSQCRGPMWFLHAASERGGIPTGRYACAKEETHAQALSCVASMQNCTILLCCMDLYCTGYLRAKCVWCLHAVYILLVEQALCSCRQALGRRCQYK